MRLSDTNDLVALAGDPQRIVNFVRSQPRVFGNLVALAGAVLERDGKKTAVANAVFRAFRVLSDDDLRCFLCSKKSGWFPPALTRRLCPSDLARICIAMRGLDDIDQCATLARELVCGLREGWKPLVSLGRKDSKNRPVVEARFAISTLFGALLKDSLAPVPFWRSLRNRQISWDGLVWGKRPDSGGEMTFAPIQDPKGKVRVAELPFEVPSRREMDYLTKYLCGLVITYLAPEGCVRYLEQFGESADDVRRKIREIWRRVSNPEASRTSWLLGDGLMWLEPTICGHSGSETGLCHVVFLPGEFPVVDLMIVTDEFTWSVGTLETIGPDGELGEVSNGEQGTLKWLLYLMLNNAIVEFLERLSFRPREVRARPQQNANPADTSTRRPVAVPPHIRDLRELRRKSGAPYEASSGAKGRAAAKHIVLPEGFTFVESGDHTGGGVDPMIVHVEL